MRFCAFAFLVTLILSLPSGAQSPEEDGLTPFELTCVFETECIDEDCAGTEFEMTVTGRLGGDGPPPFGEMEITSIAETVQGSGDYDGELLTLSGRTAGAVHMLTTLPEGARYSVHQVGYALAITYLGQCQ